MSRSVSADLELEAGTYSVLMKVTAKRDPEKPTPEEVVRKHSKNSQDKLLMIGMAYDLAHAKAQIKETEQEKELRKQREKKREAAEHKQLREEYREQKYKRWLYAKKAHEREKRHAQAKEQRRRKKANERKATNVPDDTAKAPTPGPDSQMPPDKSETPKAEEQTTVGAHETAPLPTVPEETEGQATSGAIETAPPKTAPELPSPPAEAATKDSEPAQTDIANKDQTTEDKIKQFNQSLAAIPHLNLPSTSNPSRAASSNARPPSTIPPDDDYVSDASFNSSIDTDLDGLYISAPARNDDAPPPPPPPADNGNDLDDDAEFENDPWNAVCVVGLRVYSKDPKLSVLIVRPKNEDDDEETPLDVDDPSRGACEEPVPGAGAEEGGEKK